MQAFDEMRGHDGTCRRAYALIDDWLKANQHLLPRKSEQAEVLFRRVGITFAVYTEGGDPERLIPFDPIPRILDWAEWDHLSRGLEQRVRALNMFIADVYGAQEFVKAGRIPSRLVNQNDSFERVMVGADVAEGVYTHIAGIDMVRTGPNDWYVLEDNCRTPSGVSYMLEDREVMMRLFPDLFRKYRIEPVSHYSQDLSDMLASVAPRNCPSEPTVALLTPGAFNSAYYEHTFLADEMGVELVEGQDLVVENDVVFMRTTGGLQRVDVIYRRIDDAFLDPKAFNPRSVLGVPGLFDAFKAGNVTIANSVGAGIADDKAVYTYVPDMVRFYLGEEPILNNVPTWRCSEADSLAYVNDHLSELVVKAVHGSGGYGMLVGPHASRNEIDDFRVKLNAKPNDYIAQPTLALSTCPTAVASGVAPRHVDLRPFVITGKQVRIVPGGLTRVALKDGSLVVNSSQGGGTKDTWVLSAPSDGTQYQSQRQN